jgi:hypothetical protein
MRFLLPDLHPQSWNLLAWLLDSSTTDVLSTFLLADFRHPHNTTGQLPPPAHHGSVFLRDQYHVASFPKEFPYE